MFDLEQAITEWRRTMRAAGLKEPAVLDELESHLRDAAAEEMQSGLTESEAFGCAVQRIGRAEVLRAEFARARIPNAAAIRKWAAMAYSVELVAYTMLSIRFLLKYTPNHHELLLGIGGLAVTLLAAYGGWYLAPRLLRVISNKALRESVAIIGTLLASIGWMTIFGWLILPQFDFTPGQFAVAVVWAFLPILSAPTLLLGIDLPEGQRAG